MRFQFGILLLFVFSCIAPSLAEAGTGSTYSRFGIGERRFFPSGRSAAMGGTGIALRGPAYINHINPAAWSDLPVVQFSGSLFYEGIRSRDSFNSVSLGNGNLSGAMLALPVMPSRGLTVAFGFGPMSSVGYDVETTIPVPHGSQIVRYLGSGGVTSAVIGASYRPFAQLSIGALLSYRTGILKYTTDSFFNVSVGTGYVPSTTQRTHAIDGFAGTAGIMYSGLLPNRTNETFGPLTIGLLFTTPSRLKVDEDLEVLYEVISDTTISRSGTIKLPYLVGIGIGYSVDRRNLIAIDVRYEPWENFRRFGEPDDQLRNAYRLGVGWERPGVLEPGSGFFNRTTYRLGFFYNASYFNIQNTPVNETFFTAGIGIPLSGISVLNIAAQIGVRGTTDQNLQKDRIIRLLFSLNMFERWFVPPVRD